MAICSNSKVSAAIPTIGRTETLSLVLYGLLAQTHRPKEVIILDESERAVTEEPTVNQMLDLMSIEKIEVKIIRRRHRQGIGAARILLAQEAKYDSVFMVDDDVVPRPRCLQELIDGAIHKRQDGVNWIVPHCFLISGTSKLDGYLDIPVSRQDPRVKKWVQRYPWFLPYFKYKEDIIERTSVAGTQAILWDKEVLLSEGLEVEKLGKLPREDTYLTRITAPGLFVSQAECDHFEHSSQITRGQWESSMFYKLHEVIINKPEEFLELIGE